MVVVDEGVITEDVGAEVVVEAVVGLVVGSFVVEEEVVGVLGGVEAVLVEDIWPVVVEGAWLLVCAVVE